MSLFYTDMLKKATPYLLRLKGTEATPPLLSLTGTWNIPCSLRLTGKDAKASSLALRSKETTPPFLRLKGDKCKTMHLFLILRVTDDTPLLLKLTDAQATPPTNNPKSI